MKSYKPSDVRAIGIFGHRGSGKTMLAESFLFNAGVTSRLGNVEQKNLALELDEEALDRETTMHANVGFVEWNGVRVGLVDTPGDGNFFGAAKRATQVVDAAIVMVSAADGVENITARAVTELKSRNVPFAVFVSKMDKEQADVDSLMEEIKAELSKDAVQLSLPMGKGDSFKGVVSLLTEKAWVDDGGKPKATDAPADMADTIESAREQLFDTVAAADDELAEKYLEELTLSEEDLNRGLKAAFLKGELVPVLFGVPNANLGTTLALDLVKDVFPSPLERPALKGYKSSKAENPVERVPDPNGPLVVQVFRNYNDPFAGTLSFARVWSGTVKASSDVFNATSSNSDRPSHLYFPQGGTKNGADVKEATVGDLIVLTKLKSVHTGDVLTTKDDPTFLPKFEEPRALLNFGIHAKEQKEEDKVSALIHKLCEEDPSLSFERDPETKEMLLGGLGQAHIDFVVGRLKRAKLEVVLQEPKVPYRETFRAPVMGIEGKHKKQSGGHGQFGVCFVNFEPVPRGEGIDFVDNIVGGAIPRQFIPSVEKGIRGALVRGPISGNPIVDLKVTLYDGKFHRVDSSDMAFQTAGRKAVKALYTDKKAKPILLEPYMHLLITCPADNVGDVMGDLNSRRARVNNMTTEGRKGKIDASVPMNEILRYTNVLKSLTSGRGSFEMDFDRYEEAPSNVQQQVAATYTAADDDD